MFFVLSKAWDKEKILKIYHLSYSIYKHYGIDIASPSSMQDACHMNLATEACGLVVQHRNAESEGLRFDSSWGIRIFSLSHARDKTKNIFLYFFTELKTYDLSCSIYKVIGFSEVLCRI